VKLIKPFLGKVTQT